MVEMNNLALAYLETGKPDSALPLMEESLDRMTTNLGPDHPHTRRVMVNLADAYTAAGKADKAAVTLEKALGLTAKEFGPNHPNTVRLREGLEFVRNLASADERYRATLAAKGPTDINTLLAQRDLAQLYMATRRLEEAERMLVQIAGHMEERPPNDDVRLFTVRLLGICLARQQRSNPEAWQTFNSQSRLGGVLLTLRSYRDAEPLLLQGYEGLKQRESQIPPDRKHFRAEAAGRLAELYSATGKDEAAAQWQQEREALEEAQAPE
jgi:tetratricopeptide (TPR) repeat protein